MKIVFVTNNYTPYQGGVVSSINATMHALQKRGHEVYVITLDFLQKPKQESPFIIRLHCPIKFMYRKNHMAIPWRTYAQMSDVITRIKPDVVHLHHPFLLGQSGLQVAYQLGIPTVFTYHTLYDQYAHYVPLFGRMTSNLISWKVARFCQQVDHIIAPSSFVKNKLTAEGITTPVKIIPSSVQQKFFQVQDAKNLSHPVELLFVGRFAPEKNIPFLIDVFKQLPHKEFHFTLVGYGTEFEKMQAYAYSTLSIAQGRITFVHKPDSQKLLDLYTGAHLFLFSSETDTQGLVLAEAMAAGLPVIALDGPGQRDIVQQGQNGFLVQNRASMADKICQIAQNKPLYKKLSRHAIDSASKYAPGAIIDDLVHLYSSP